MDGEVEPTSKFIPPEREEGRYIVHTRTIGINSLNAREGGNFGLRVGLRLPS